MSNSIFLDTINGIKTERPPVWFMRQAGRVLPSYLKLREEYSFREMMQNPELAAKVTLLPVNDLGVDAAILFSDILVIPEALGMGLNFTDKGPVFNQPLHNAKDQVSTLIPDTSKLDHIYKAIDVVREQKPADVALIGFCGAPLTTFCYMVEGNSAKHDFAHALNLFYNDPKTTAEIFEKITELSIEYACKQADHGIDTFQLFETHAGLIPYELYIERVLPYVKRILDAVRAKNVPTIFFPKGLGYGMAKLDFDIADFISIDWQFSMSDARKLIDPRVGLQGNFDQRIFSVNDQRMVEAELKKYLAFGKENQNWIFNAGHGFTPDNKIENIRFAIDWVKNTNWNRS